MEFHSELYRYDKKSKLGFPSTIGLKSNSLQPDKVMVITTASTASASKLVISGLNND